MQEQMIESFLLNIETNEYLQPLLPKEEWVLMIQVNDRQWRLSVSKDAVQLCSCQKEVNSRLICSFDDWRDMLTGQCKLRQVLKLGDAIYEGTFRSLLMLESIFYLQTFH